MLTIELTYFTCLLVVAYLFIKLDDSSFSHSTDVIGASQNLNGSCDPKRPFRGWFVICRLALAMINLPTKFEVSVSTHYKDMIVTQTK